MFEYGKNTSLSRGRHTILLTVVWLLNITFQTVFMYFYELIQASCVWFEKLEKKALL